MSIFKVPVGVVKKLESLRARFFWGAVDGERKICWVKWDCILNSLDKGGLGVGSLCAFNQALLYKWKWRFVNKPTALWCKVLRACHGVDAGLNSMVAGRVGKGVWKGILAVINTLHESGVVNISVISKVLGNGGLTSFWWDTWCGSQPFRLRFQNLYKISRYKEGTVREYRSMFGWMIQWTREPRRGIEMEQLVELLASLSSVHITDSQDKWIWDIDPGEDFTVRSLRVHIDGLRLPSLQTETRWFRYIPIKVNILLWRLELDRLPTRQNLERRGVSLTSNLCPICNNVIETVEHVFFSCDLATQLWKRVCSWVELDYPTCGSIQEMWQWVGNLRLSLENKQVLTAICMSTTWVVWWFRNDVVFSSKKLKRILLFDLIILYSFNWFTNRNSKVSRTWNAWVQNPMANYL